MYSIRIRLNKRCIQLKHGDKERVGVRLNTGRIRYYNWRGFTLEPVHHCKLVVDSFTNESDWDPRNTHSKMPNWIHLDQDEYLLGSWDAGFVYTVLPFRVVS